MTRPATHRMPALLVGLILAIGIGIAGAGFVVVSYRVMQINPRIIALE